MEIYILLRHVEDRTSFEGVYVLLEYVLKEFPIKIFEELL
jgi:hypothetical protein